MGVRTLASSWRHFEKLLAKTVPAGDPPPPGVAELVDKVNASRITGALASLFVEPYPDMEEVSVAFAAGDAPANGGAVPTSYCEQSKTIRINPQGVLFFRDDCTKAGDRLKTAETRRSFSDYRYQAYLAEIAKLPTYYLLFLLLLREVATARRITRVVRKGGAVEEITDPADLGYMNLLWAFKELESFYRSSKGLNLRAEYGIRWHESDWIVGR